jgi:hypothetical protein
MCGAVVLSIVPLFMFIGKDLVGGRPRNSKYRCVRRKVHRRHRVTERVARDLRQLPG